MWFLFKENLVLLLPRLAIVSFEFVRQSVLPATTTLCWENVTFATTSSTSHPSLTLQLWQKHSTFFPPYHKSSVYTSGPSPSTNLATPPSEEKPIGNAVATITFSTSSHVHHLQHSPKFAPNHAPKLSRSTHVPSPTASNLDTHTSTLHSTGS